MLAEILSIGDEITSGQTLDTNSQWLSRRLEELGIRTLYHTTVGDELEPNLAVFRQAIERADLVIATGGLGPTADDLTREALAKAVGRELVLYPEALEQIRRLFALRKREMPKQNELQALFPEGSRMIVNSNGTAPGIDLEIPRPGRSPCRFFALPGVPAEMRDLWQSYLSGEVAKLVGNANKIVRKKINCFGAGESQIEAMLPDMIRRGRSPTVGITASQASISLRIDAEAATEEECRNLIEPTEKIIRECLGDLIFGEGDEELQHVLVRMLRERRQTLAVVEWGAGGLVTHWLSESPDAKTCYLSSSVFPDANAASQFLPVDPRTLAEKDDIRNLVVETCRALKSDWLLLVADQSKHDEPESVCVHLAFGNENFVKTQTLTQGIYPSLRNIYIAKHALNLARLAILADRRSKEKSGR
jgi:nicotinamide-nucleotide amidase